MMLKNKLAWSFVVFFILGAFYQGFAGADEGGGKQFEYSQKKLNRIEEKNRKYRVAIGNFDGPVDIAGSQFNKTDNKEAVNSTAYNINISSSNLEKPLEPKVDHVAGLLSDLMRRMGMFNVVERSEVNQLIREIKFGGSDWVKKDAAAQLGNIYGVQYLLLGDVLPNKSDEQFGVRQYTASLRLVDINTGAVVSTGTGQGNVLNNALLNAVGILAQDIKADAWTCRIVRIDDKGVYINAGLDDEIEKNDVYAVIRLEDPIIDQSSGHILGYKQNKIAKIKIIEVLEKGLSLAKQIDVKEPIKEGDIVSAERVKPMEEKEMSLWNRIFGRS